MFTFYGERPAKSSSDIDLREELKQIIWTEKRGVYLIYRKVTFEIQDGRYMPKKCVCFDHLTQEPSRDIKCNICEGLGYFFKDHIVKGYKSSSQGFSATTRQHDTGQERYSYPTFYLQHNCISALTGNNLDIPTTYDKIIEIEQDVNVSLSSNIRQLIKYDIINVDTYRLDGTGRVEFYRIRTRASLEGSYLI